MLCYCSVLQENRWPIKVKLTEQAKPNQHPNQQKTEGKQKKRKRRKIKGAGNNVKEQTFSRWPKFS